VFHEGDESIFDENQIKFIATLEESINSKCYQEEEKTFKQTKSLEKIQYY